MYHEVSRTQLKFGPGRCVKKKRFDVHDSSTKKDDICNRRQNTPQGICVQFGLNQLHKKRPVFKFGCYGFN